MTPFIIKDNNPVFIGLDISVTSSGVAVIDSKGALLNIFRILTGTPSTKNKNIKCFDKNKKYERYQYIYDTVFEEITKHSVALICIEEVHVSHISSAIPLIELATFIRKDLYFKKYNFFTVRPSRIKKFLSGKGNIEKEAIPKEVFKRWGVDTNYNDEADAYCMAQFARYYYCYKNNIDINIKKQEIKMLEETEKDTENFFYYEH